MIHSVQLAFAESNYYKVRSARENKKGMCWAIVIIVMGHVPWGRWG